MSTEKVTMDSPVFVKLAGDACVSEDKAGATWYKLAGLAHMAGVLSADLADEKGETYKKMRSVIVSVQKPNIVTLLMASSAIGFTEQERSDRTFWKNRVDRVYMARIKEHLKKYEENERGTIARKTFGEVLAKECQDMVDRIRRAKEEKIDFDAVDTVAALKELKAMFLA